MADGCCSAFQGLAQLTAQGLAKAVSRYGGNVQSPMMRHCLSNDRKERRIDDFYDAGEEIGQGAFGTVVLRRHRPTQQMRAVKQIPWAAAGQGAQKQEERQNAIKQELQALILLDHPNVAKFREWFVDAIHGIYFVSEFCEGGSLERHLLELCETPREQRLVQEADFRGLFQQLVYAVSYVHSCGVIHRDIKPDNCLLSGAVEDGQLCLIDFGLAALADAEPSKMDVGTLEFMSPELFLGKPADESFDVWALGVTMVQIISAVQKGKLLHPFVDMDQDNAHIYYYLLTSYTHAEPWDRDVMEGASKSSTELLERILVYENRATAAELQFAEWLTPEEEKDLSPFDDFEEEIVAGGRRSTEEMSPRRRRSSLEDVDEEEIVKYRSWSQLSDMDRGLLELTADCAPRDNHRMRTLSEGYSRGRARRVTDASECALQEEDSDDSECVSDAVLTSTSRPRRSDDSAGFVSRLRSSSASGSLRRPRGSSLDSANLQNELRYSQWLAVMADQDLGDHITTAFASMKSDGSKDNIDADEIAVEDLEAALGIGDLGVTSKSISRKEFQDLANRALQRRRGFSTESIEEDDRRSSVGSD